MKVTLLLITAITNEPFSTCISGLTKRTSPSSIPKFFIESPSTIRAKETSFTSLSGIVMVSIGYKISSSSKGEPADTYPNTGISLNGIFFNVYITLSSFSLSSSFRVLISLFNSDTSSSVIIYSSSFEISSVIGTLNVSDIFFNTFSPALL